MKITTLTILVLLASLGAVWSTLNKYRGERLGTRSAALWTGVWLIIGFGAVFPDTMDWFMRLAMMTNRVYFVFLIAIFALFAMIFAQSSRMELTQRHLAQLAQRHAILEQRLRSVEPVRHDATPPENGESETR